VTGTVLLFCLVFGMSATVDIGCLWAQLKNVRAISAGCFLQFVVLPFLGFLVVKTLKLSATMGITLLVVTSSPGGSYSNWWCSMFNADLALSVTMTAISTLLSVITLPVNLFIYARLAYDDDVTSSLDWGSLFTSLMIVISAIGLGLLASYHINSHNFNLHANRLGNFAGIALVLFSGFLSNSDSDQQIWDRDWRFFLGVALPCLLGLLIANLMTTGMALLRPERVTVSIECVYQNVGIATSVALTMFDGDDLAEAMGVPFYYGMVEMVVLSTYCIVAWKAGWTKAPSDVSFWTALTTSYEILSVEKAENVLENGTEHPLDENFEYVKHADNEKVLSVAELTTVSDIATDPARRQKILNKGKKEPSYITEPLV
jgi:predicted Na+-dependent transporter